MFLVFKKKIFIFGFDLKIHPIYVFLKKKACLKKSYKLCPLGSALSTNDFAGGFFFFFAALKRYAREHFFFPRRFFTTTSFFFNSYGFSFWANAPFGNQHCGKVLLLFSKNFFFKKISKLLEGNKPRNCEKNPIFSSQKFFFYFRFTLWSIFFFSFGKKARPHSFLLLCRLCHFFQWVKRAVKFICLLFDYRAKKTQV